MTGGRSFAFGVVLAVALGAGFVSCGDDQTDMRRVSVARRLPLDQPALVARLAPQADRVEIRAVVESLALTPGVAAAEADYEQSRLVVQTDEAEATQAARRVLEASPVVTGFGP
ncbi:MAG: hypothetical protein ACRD0C_19375 [Acidimicrobiia bacterium]